VLIRLPHPEKHCDEFLPKSGTTLGISTPTAAHAISSEAISAFKWYSPFCGCGNRIGTVHSTGFQPVSFSCADSWPRLCRSHRRSRKGLPSAGSGAGGLPVPCDPREPTYFSRWLFSEFAGVMTAYLQTCQHSGTAKSSKCSPLIKSYPEPAVSC